MEVRTGYKQTEIGIIPNDWAVKQLKECCSKITDGTHDTPIPVKTGVPFLTAIHVKQNTIDFENCYFLPEIIHKEIYRRCNPEKDDVLMVNIGAGIATTALVNVNFEFSLKNVALLKPNRKMLSGAYLNSYQEHIKGGIVAGLSSGGAQPFLSLGQIGEIQIALPKLSEQTAIAAALSDTHALINSLEKLIIKKQNIKQGAMQQLLQPKESWEVKKLGEISKIFKGKGLAKSSLSDNGANSCLLYGELFTIYTEVIKTVVSRTNSNDGIVSRNGDLLFPGSTTTIGVDLAKCSALMVDGVLLGGDIIILRRKNDSYDSQFLSYFLNTKRTKEIAEKTKGITIHHLYGSDLIDISVAMPDPEIQRNIAKTLSDLDLEIISIEATLKKYKQIKQGMMQQLLTGKIRLV